MELLLYHYYFNGIDQALVIQATCRDEARRLVPAAIQASALHKDKTIDDIINETVSEPLTGITKRLIDGRPFVWGGQERGWLPEKPPNEKST